MSQALPHLLTDLPSNQTLRIADGKAHVISVFEGQVWLTQDGDQRDVFLEAGDSFSFDDRGLTLVQALRDTRLVVSDRSALDGRGPTGIGSWLRRAGAALSHRPLHAATDFN